MSQQRIHSRGIYWSVGEFSSELPKLKINTTFWKIVFTNSDGIFIVVHGRWTFFKWVVLEKWKGETPLVKVILIPTPCHSVCILPLWNVERYVLKRWICDSSKSFRSHFCIEDHGEIPSCNTIFRWVNPFTFKRSVIKTKLPSLLQQHAHSRMWIE